MRVSPGLVRWVFGATGLVVIAASCADSTRADDDDDGASGAGSGEAGETARGGTTGGGTSGASSGGMSGRSGSSSGGDAAGGADGGEGGSTDGRPSGGEAGDGDTGGSTSSGGAGGVSGTGGGGIAGSSGGVGGGAGAGGSGGALGGSGGSGPGGAGGVGGAAGAGATGPYLCEMPKVANCGAINDFPSSSMQSWGSGDFSGGFSVFGTGIQREATTANIHITGMVSGYGRGFNMWFASCSTLAAYAGITFTLSGTTADAMTPNAMSFEIQTNANYPWQPYPSEHKGACTANTGSDPFAVCRPSITSLMLAASVTFVSWAQMTGGSPVPWSASLSPAEIVGLQWQFPWSEGRKAYAVDVTLDNLRFTGGTGPTTVCSTFTP